MSRRQHKSAARAKRLGRNRVYHRPPSELPDWPSTLGRCPSPHVAPIGRKALHAWCWIVRVRDMAGWRQRGSGHAQTKALIPADICRLLRNWAIMESSLVTQCLYSKSAQIRLYTVRACPKDILGFRRSWPTAKSPTRLPSLPPLQRRRC
jgi:hypothetical protein